MRLGVRVAAGFGDRRCGAACRDDLAGDPWLELLQARGGCGFAVVGDGPPSRVSAADGTVSLVVAGVGF